MLRLSLVTVLTGWGISVAGSLATLYIGANVLAAQAMGGLLSLFPVPSGATTAPGKAGLLWALLPAALAILGNAWLLYAGRRCDDGVHAGWLVASLLLAIATFSFGVWVCVDVWPSQGN